MLRKELEDRPVNLNDLNNFFFENHFLGIELN